MRLLLLIPIVASLAACSLFSESPKKTFTTNYAVDLTTVTDSLGRPDSVVAWVDLNTVPTDTLAYGSTDLQGSNVLFVLESGHRDSIRVNYRMYRGGKAIAGNDQTIVQGDSALVVAAPLLVPGLELVPETVPVGKSWNPTIRIHNRTKQALHIAADFDGNGTWDMTVTRSDYMFTKYTTAGTYTMLVRVYDDLGLEVVDSMQVTVVP